MKANPIRTGCFPLIAGLVLSCSSDPELSNLSGGDAGASAGGGEASMAGAGGATAGAAMGGGGSDQDDPIQAGGAGGGAIPDANAGAGGDTESGGAGGSGDVPIDIDSDIIDALKEYLAVERDQRKPIADQAFADRGLTAAEAEVAQTLLWQDYASMIRATRQAESDEKAITIGDYTLKYDFKIFGEEPADGHSLFISLHGGGEGDGTVNDQQWENQKILYEPDEGIYLAPRGPTDTWNLWHQDHIDGLFNRLITNLIVLENVNPNRIYVMGYSAGGDGVYQLGPRMADFWAAAAMMAGHPNDAKPDSLRNIGFTIHVGGLDTAFDRNLVAAEWGAMLDNLQAADPEGYPHYVEVHPDKPHWMDLEDAVAVPWMAEFTRNPIPDRVVWLQDDVPHERFYWLAVNPADAETEKRVVAEYAGQQVTIESSDVAQLKIRLSDAMLDLDQPVSVVFGSDTVFEGLVERTILMLYTTLEERGDPAMAFSSEVLVEL